MVTSPINLGPFDLFAKSIPGAVLLLGLLLLFPNEFEAIKPYLVTNNSPLDLAAALIVFLLLGLLLGEGIHTISNYLERILHRVLYEKPKTEFWEERKIQERRKTSLLVPRFSFSKYFYFYFRPHRKVFEDAIKREWLEDEYIIDKLGVSLNLFRRSCLAYNIWDPNTEGNLYMVVFGYLSEKPNWRSERFEVLYLLNRGMWAVLATLLILHTGSYTGTLPWQMINQGRWGTFLVDSIWTREFGIVIVLFFLSLVFLKGAADYKRHMVGYTMTDFSVFATPQLFQSNRFRGPAS